MVGPSGHRTSKKHVLPIRKDLMQLPKIIQGGMGVAISDWQLARAVALQGQAGTVSGTGIALIMISRLMDGDADGHMRRALGQFPFPKVAQKIIDKYYVAGSKQPAAKPAQRRYARSELWTLTPSQELNELTVVANFVEIFLAKDGHQHPVGLNLLEKIQMPIMASLYGAMLAGVDYVLMGAGIPVQIPDILERLAAHQAVSYKMDVRGASPEDDHQIHFDPQSVFPDLAQSKTPLTIPYFLPIISSVVLAKTMIKRTAGRVDGFVIEGPTAGGHNAPPRNQKIRDDKGQPVYGKKDEVDLAVIKGLGLPFWLAGGYDSADMLQEALAMGASGIQVGTAFAFCRESGLESSLNDQVIQQVMAQHAAVRTDPLISTTGFPFKTVQIEGTLSDADLAEDRVRLCDIGMLRQLYKREDGIVGYRCPGEPQDNYVKKGGDLQETVGRGCLCNSLCATAGFPQQRKDGYIELPVVTAGDGLSSISKFVKPGQDGYSAGDVLDYLLQASPAIKPSVTPS